MAAGLAAEIKNARGIEAKLIEGSEGIFKVVLDGTILFSKHETGRFPEPGEVLEQIPAAG